MNQIVTTKQNLVLVKIHDLYQENSTSPTFEELRIALNYSRISSIQRHIDALKIKGLLQSEKYQPRTICLTVAGQEAIGKSLAKVRFDDTFPTYQVTLPFTIPLEKASVPTNYSSIAYKNSPIKNNGTAISNFKPSNTKITSGDKSLQPNLFGGTTKKYQSLISVQNSTINLPLHSLNFSNAENFLVNNDYLMIVATSFALTRIFNVGFLWFTILLSSFLLIKKLNRYL